MCHGFANTGIRPLMQKINRRRDNTTSGARGRWAGREGTKNQLGAHGGSLKKFYALMAQDVLERRVVFSEKDFGTSHKVNSQTSSPKRAHQLSE